MGLVPLVAVGRGKAVRREVEAESRDEAVVVAAGRGKAVGKAKL